jgi:cytochrome c oxidase assembly protein subunit 11
MDTAARIRRTAIVCTGVVFGMVGLSFAAVPLYDLFCKVTGFGGTPVIGTAGAGTILERTMQVSFDSNVSPQLGWRFEPEQRAIMTPIGRTETVFYKITNRTDRPATGIASYNVEPAQVAPHFVKIQCFCFTEQTLQPGESLEVPVVFYIDPEIAQNRALDGMKSVTLSYTFFPAKNGQPAASAKGDDGRPTL